LSHKNRRALKRILFSLALLIPFCVQAQRHHEIGIFAGVSNYHGDLQSKWYPDYGYKPNVGIIYKYFMHPRVGLRFGANYTRLTAADSLSDIPIHKARNLRFETGLFEVHGGLEINLLAVDIDRAKVSPYVFGGVAVFYYNPYTDGMHGEKVYLRPLSTEGQGIPVYPDRKQYSLVNVAFPIGGGFKFLIGKALMINTEIGFRYTATDYLDDVSKSYVNDQTLFDYRSQQSVDLAWRQDEVPGVNPESLNYPDYKFQRGDSKANDWYWFGGISVSVYLNAFSNVADYWQTKCPGLFGKK
jgi:hypothetical protein